MKCPILRAGLMFGALSVSLTGCQHTKPSTESVGKSNPGDPTAWSDKDLSKDDSGSSGASSSLPRSSMRQGTWSSEAQEVERSLGVGR